MANSVVAKFQGWNITITQDPEGKWTWAAERKRQTDGQHPGSPAHDTKYEALDDAKAQLGKGKA